MKKYFPVFHIIIVLSGIFFTGAIQSVASVPSMDQVYETDVATVNSFRSLHDLSRMEKVCDQLLSKWHKKDPRRFINLTCETCIVLSSIYFHDSHQYQLDEKYALAALNDSAPKSIDTQACLVMYGLSHDIGSATSASPNWVGKRKKLAQWWLSTWQRIDQEIDPHFDPKAYPVTLTVPAPADLDKKKQTFIPGMASAVIKDPKLRKEYEQAIAQNIRNSEIVIQQRSIRDLKSMFDKVGKRYFISAYTALPYQPDELNDLLRTYVADEAVRNDIMDAVKKVRDGQ